MSTSKTEELNEIGGLYQYQYLACDITVQCYKMVKTGQSVYGISLYYFLQLHVNL